MRIVKLTLAVLLAALLTAFTACSGKVQSGADAQPASGETPKPAYDVSVDHSLNSDLTLESSIDAAPVIFEGTCVEKRLYEPTHAADMDFRIEKTYRGELLTGDTVCVMGNDAGAYAQGSSYILFAVPQASVYSGKPLYYQVDMLIALSDGSCVCELPDVNGTTPVDTAERIEAYIAAHPFKGNTDVTGVYCTSDDLNEIAAFSDCVLLVKANEVLVNEGDRTVYSCSVTDCIKGSAGSTVNVAAFKNSMALDGEYLLLLTDASSGMVQYTMSSQRSVLEAGSPEAIQLINDLK